MDAVLVKKLLVRPGNRVMVINAPEGYLDRISPLPEGATFVSASETPADLVQLFVRSRAELRDLAPNAIGAVKPGGVLWVSYPKRGPKVQTDINRDTGWDTVRELGWGPVTQIALDETWSALRLRPEADVQRSGHAPWTGKSEKAE